MSEHQQMQQSKESKPTFQKQATLTSQMHVSHPAAIIQRSRIDPKSLTAADVLQLQHTIGNRAVGRLLSEIRNPSKVQQVPIQRQEMPEEEEPLEGKFGKESDQEMCPSCMQRQEIPEEEEPLQGEFETIQRLEPEEEKLQMKSVVQKQEIPEEEPLQGVFENKPEQAACPSCIQRKELEEGEPLQTKRENNTGLPDNLKAGVENLSGIDMSNVRVHYNSDKPAQVGALAYTQGTNIHVAPGQERHLLHEAWHVVQQAQGRVKPTIQMKGMAVNDDVGLEAEADVVGKSAIEKESSRIKDNFRVRNQRPPITKYQKTSIKQNIEDIVQLSQHVEKSISPVLQRAGMKFHMFIQNGEITFKDETNQIFKTKDYDDKNGFYRLMDPLIKGRIIKIKNRGGGIYYIVGTDYEPTSAVSASLSACSLVTTSAFPFAHSMVATSPLPSACLQLPSLSVEESQLEGILHCPIGRQLLTVMMKRLLGVSLVEESLLEEIRHCPIGRQLLTEMIKQLLTEVTASQNAEAEAPQLIPQQASQLPTAHLSSSSPNETWKYTISDEDSIAIFVKFMNPEKYKKEGKTLGKFMQDAQKEFKEKTGFKDADWKSKKDEIEQYAKRYFFKTEEKPREKADDRIKPEHTPRQFDPNDNATWNMQQLEIPEGLDLGDVVLDAHDRFFLDRLRHGELTNNCAAFTPMFNVRYHAHMVGNGGGGIAFYYVHTGGNNVRPVIYDWATRRTGNDYYWVKYGKKSNSAPPRK